MASTRNRIEKRFAILADLDTISMEGFDAFIELIVAAHDEELFRMSQHRFTDRTGVPVQQAIDLFLYATHLGVLEFR